MPSGALFLCLLLVLRHEFRSLSCMICRCPSPFFVYCRPIVLGVFFVLCASRKRSGVLLSAFVYCLAYYASILPSFVHCACIECRHRLCRPYQRLLRSDNIRTSAPALSGFAAMVSPPFFCCLRRDTIPTTALKSRLFLVVVQHTMLVFSLTLSIAPAFNAGTALLSARLLRHSTACHATASQ